MKAYVATGFSIKEINQQLALGATIDENGQLLAPTLTDTPTNSSTQDVSTQTPPYIEYLYFAGGLLLIVIPLAITVIISKNKQHKK